MLFCRFKQQVRPGDQPRLEVEITRVKGAIGSIPVTRISVQFALL